MGRTMRSRGASSYKSNKRSKRGNKLSKRLSKRRVKRTNKRSNRRLNRKSFKRVSKHIKNNRKSYRRGGAPGYVLQCTKYQESTGSDGKNYIEYCINVKGNSFEDFSIWRRWSLCQDLDNACYALPWRDPKITARPKYSLKFPSRSVRAGTGREYRGVLLNRQSDLNDYFMGLGGWLNSIVKTSNGEIDLMKKPTGPGELNEADPHNVVRNFFFKEIDQTLYEETLKKTKAELKKKQRTQKAKLEAERQASGASEETETSQTPEAAQLAEKIERQWEESEKKKKEEGIELETYG